MMQRSVRLELTVSFLVRHRQIRRLSQTAFLPCASRVQVTCQCVSFHLYICVRVVNTNETERTCIHRIDRFSVYVHNSMQFFVLHSGRQIIHEIHIYKVALSGRYMFCDQLCKRLASRSVFLFCALRSHQTARLTSLRVVRINVAVVTVTSVDLFV
jgi:hypothetical protein